MLKTIILLSMLLGSISLSAYRYDSGQLYVSGGLGAHINVVRHEGKSPTPKAYMPFYGTLDYAIDRNFGVFASFAPQFSGGVISFLSRAGIKYWFSFLETPYVPYVSLAITPELVVPTSSAKNHINIGISPGIGINYFVMAHFLVGMHLNFNPTFAFIDGQKQMELGVIGLFDVSFRI
ncbi:MAG: hypothetical protein KC505_08120 [Myxococcales bacterium]|nr:hypothetical protein [Myxococcales bacterium]USN51103.1 MAG: hypothetical protein H6731_01455 [Myxococcales bacterium]